MYKLNYYVTEKRGSQVLKDEFTNAEFRLRKDALNYLLGIVRKEYEQCGYTTTARVGGIHCYRNILTEKGVNITEDVIIRVEKVK
jgi:hypothetical protein